jgi:hypothetical protein
MALAMPANPRWLAPYHRPPNQAASPRRKPLPSLIGARQDAAGAWWTPDAERPRLSTAVDTLRHRAARACRTLGAHCLELQLDQQEAAVRLLLVIEPIPQACEETMAVSTHHAAQRSALRQTLHEAAPLARYANMLLGLWLFLSAFAWSHPSTSRTNTWILGLSIAISATVALGSAILRRVSSMLALCLAFSTLPTYAVDRATFFNNLVVAVVVFALSLIPNRDERALETDVH